MPPLAFGHSLLDLTGWNLLLNSTQQRNGDWNGIEKGVETECVSFNFIFSLHLEGFAFAFAFALLLLSKYNTLHTFA